MKVDASPIHLETPLNPRVSCTHGWRALLWGRLFNLRPGPEGAPNRPGRLRTTCQQAGCQPAAGCHPAPRAASDSTFMSHTPSRPASFDAEQASTLPADPIEVEVEGDTT